MEPCFWQSQTAKTYVQGQSLGEPDPGGNAVYEGVLGRRARQQERAVARLWAKLQGPAKEVVRMCSPQDFEDARGVERLLRFLRESPLAAMPVPDAYKKIQAYDQIRRRPERVIGDSIVRGQCAFREMTEAPRRSRNSRDEKTGARCRTHQPISGHSSVHSDAERRGRRRRYVHRSTTATRTDWPDILRIGDPRIPPSTKCSSLSKRATD